MIPDKARELVGSLGEGNFSKSVFYSGIAPKLFGLFGNTDGNGAVTSPEFAAFRTFFGLGASIFDFDGNGQTNSNDFAEFRKRFGLMI